MFLAQAHARLADALDGLDPILGPLGQRFADAGFELAPVSYTHLTLPTKA